ncbi:MAG TPA: PAS domain S-box protein [Caldilineaceae bacterium]|nr:PAS domain S-box protein [Caldilineaceae bacterium]
MATQSKFTPVTWDAQVSLRHLVESAPIALAIVDGEGQIAYANSRLNHLFGYMPDELLGQPIEVLIPEHLHAAHLQHRRRYMREPHVRSMGLGMDLLGRHKDGTVFPVEVGLSPFLVGDESFVIATITDISKRKQVEEMLVQRVEERTREIERRQQESEGLRNILSALISNGSLPEILDLIADQAVRLLRADACAIYRRDERVGHLQLQAASGPVADEWARLLTQLLARQTPLYNEPMVFAPGLQPVPAFRFSAFPAATGSQLHEAAYFSVPIRDTRGVYGLILLYYRQPGRFVPEDIDLALRMADQTALAVENAHLRTQIERTAVAAERSRIARDLHDAVTQTLFSASIIAEVLPMIWQRNEAEGRRRLEELRELTRGALAEMRTLLLELRPAKLIEVELADLLRQLAEAIAGRARVPVKVEVEGSADLPPDVKVALYRVAQEALNNVAKHAQANHAWLRLQMTPEQVTLTVHDDGCGFVFERIAPEHLGLGIMRERAEGIGATLSVRSQPAQGTTIEVGWRRKQAPA